MKKKWFLGLAGVCLSCGGLNADIDDSFYESEQVYNETSEGASDGGTPFSFFADVDWIGKSKINKHGFHGQHIRFNDASVGASSVIYYNPDCDEGANVTLKYSTLYLDWKENPYFSQNRFNQASIAFGGFTKRVYDWLWQGQFEANFDTRHRDYNHFTNFNMLLWGRYAWCEHLGIHGGFLALTGMKIDHVYPVIGIDWQIDAAWKLNLIFPLDVSLTYAYDDNWTFAVAGRFFDLIRRVGADQPLPHALFEYRNIGVELAANYLFCGWLKANVHAGYTTGGMLRISDKHNKHPKHFKFDSAPYAGGELSLNF